MSDWNARRILRELVDADRRRAILADFWRFADSPTRLAAQAQLAKTLNFRELSIRKMPPDKKADLLASRLGTGDFDQFLEEALMQYHTHRANALMGTLLDHWRIPHVDGAIEGDVETAPDAAAVREAVAALPVEFDRGDVRLYLAAAGLLMGDAWREATWGVVDEMA